MKLILLKYLFLLVVNVVMLCKLVISQPQIKVIDVGSAFDLRSAVNCSSFANNIEYVKLESNSVPRCGAQAKVFVDGKYIITISHSNILLFDRHSGKLIREIGKKGDAGNQYFSTNYILPFVEKKGVFITKGKSNSIKEYTLNGKFSKEIKTPVAIGNSIYWKDNTYIQYVSNITGSESRKLVVFTLENKTIKTFRNTQEYRKTSNGFYFSNREGMFYTFNDSLFFKETFNDTVFCVTGSNLNPKYVFQTGKRKVSYQTKAEINLQNIGSYFFIENLDETPNYLFFQIKYRNKLFAAVYYKNQNTCKVSYNTNPLRYGFYNDIDYFLPMYYSTVSTENELIGYCLPFEIKHWLSQNKNRNEEQFIGAWGNVKETDNPIIMIAKLKE